MLLRRGAKLETYDRGGATPLILACGAASQDLPEKRVLPVVKALVEAKANVNAKDHGPTTNGQDKSSRM